MKTQVKAMLLAIGMSLFPSFLSFASTPLQLVPYVDLNRYMGDWHVIANIPNFIEKDCVSSIESYALRQDGNIDNWFACKKADGHETKLTSLAWVYDTKSQAEWRVRFNLDTFFGRIPIPLHFNYSVIDLDSVNYRYTVVGHPSRRLLWIMARDPFMDDAIYDQILIKVKSQGYDLSKIVKLQKSH